MDADLDRVSKKIQLRINNKQYSLGLSQSGRLKGKDVFKIDTSDVVSYFISLQLQHNLKSSFNITYSSRRFISEQLYRSLLDNTPKLIAKTDLKSFYESLDHEILEYLINENKNLSMTSKKFIKTLIDEYAELTGQSKGVPRGVGISGLLAEAYLRNLDEELSRMPGVITYLRYVDDIVIVFVESETYPEKESRKRRIRQVSKKYRLMLNPSKTNYFHTGKNQSTPVNLSFLGYHYRVDKSKVVLDITKKRYDKYKNKIDKAIDACAKSRYSPEAQLMFVERVKYLTSNTRLSNNKRQALVGIYYSNSLLKCPGKRIISLDRYLDRTKASSNLTTGIKSALEEYSFELGFSARTFYRYSPKRINKITRIWKYD